MLKNAKDGAVVSSSEHTPSKKFASLFHLRRITTSGSYIPEIDGLRFVAILAVVLYHVPIQIALRSADQAATSPFWRTISHGDRGVQLFFVISGFILGMPFAAHILNGRSPVRLGSYFLRRVTRLEPPYILAILLRFPLLAFVMHRPFREILHHGLATLLYTHSILYGQMSTVNPPAWSLEVEIQFYLLAPLLALSYFSIRQPSFRRASGLAFLFVAGLLQQHFMPAEIDSWTLSILNYVQYFFAGFLLCDLYLTDWKKIPSHWTWDLVSLAAWAWIFLAQGGSLHILLPVVTLVAYLAAFKGHLFNAFFRLSWVSITGGMCYSLYLTHNLTITAVDLFLRHLPGFFTLSQWLRVALAYAVVLPAVAFIGLILYLFVERPCMDKSWPAKLYRSIYPSPSPASGPS